MTKKSTFKKTFFVSSFIRNHYDDFLAFNDVKIYYDNGQVEVSKLLSSVFNKNGDIFYTNPKLAGNCLINMNQPLGCPKSIGQVYVGNIKDYLK